MLNNEETSDLLNKGSNFYLPAQTFRTLFDRQNNEDSNELYKGTIVETGEGGSEVEITYILDKYPWVCLFEGDILIGDGESLGVHPTRKPVNWYAQIRNHYRGMSNVEKDYYWPNATVPYMVEPSLVEDVKKAIAHFEKYTRVRFTPYNKHKHKDYVSFSLGVTSHSPVGRQGGKQTISIGAGYTIGVILHQIGHSLGLWHEHSRLDRDDYIEIIKENMDPRNLYNFEKHPLASKDPSKDFGGYDYESIMHYPANVFSINGQPTIKAKGGQSIGSRNGLSKGDIHIINLMCQQIFTPDAVWSRKVKLPEKN